jgi:hypothetical protein
MTRVWQIQIANSGDWLVYHLGCACTFRNFDMTFGSVSRGDNPCKLVLCNSSYDMAAAKSNLCGLIDLPSGMCMSLSAFQTWGNDMMAGHHILVCINFIHYKFSGFVLFYVVVYSASYLYNNLYVWWWTRLFVVLPSVENTLLYLCCFYIYR